MVDYSAGYPRPSKYDCSKANYEAKDQSRATVFPHIVAAATTLF